MPETVFFAQVLDVVHFESDYDLLAWLKVDLFEKRGLDLVGNALLKSCGIATIPLGAGYEFTRRAHVYRESGVHKVNKLFK